MNPILIVGIGFFVLGCGAVIALAWVIGKASH